MSALTFDLDIWIDGQDEPIRIRADQREISQFELKYRVGFATALDEMPTVFFRFLAFGAAKRLGKIDAKADRDVWLDTVVGAEPVGDEDEPAHPGNPEAPDGLSSTSL